jgi:hypothetical protein
MGGCVLVILVLGSHPAHPAPEAHLDHTLRGAQVYRTVRRAAAQRLYFSAEFPAPGHALRAAADKEVRQGRWGRF